jgi:dCTP deaminase
MSILSDTEIKARCVHSGYTHIIDYVEPSPHAIGHGDCSFDGKREYDRPATEEELAAFRPMITPFTDGQVREEMGSITKPMGSVGGIPQMVTIPTGPSRRLISYGLDSQGYDVRLGEDVKVFNNVIAGVVDPKRFDAQFLAKATVLTDEDGGRYIVMPPHSCALGVAIEKFRMPSNVSGICLGKTTYARCGIVVNPTIIKPGFEGDLVLEFSNTMSLPARLYINEGAASIVFFHSAVTPAKAYSELGGLYQGQQGVQLPIV